LAAEPVALGEGYGVAVRQVQDVAVRVVVAVEAPAVLGVVVEHRLHVIVERELAARLVAGRRVTLRAREDAVRERRRLGLHVPRLLRDGCRFTRRSGLAWGCMLAAQGRYAGYDQHEQDAASRGDDGGNHSAPLCACGALPPPVEARTYSIRVPVCP